MKFKRVVFNLIFVLFFVGCIYTPEVTRVDTEKQVDLSGNWNDTDSRLVAETMTQDILSAKWILDFSEKNSQNPVVVVGDIWNKTHELISTDTFIKDIEREFINSGKVRIVQAGEAREQLRNERADQQQFARPETAAKWGRELGADFLLQGVINSIIDEVEGQKVVYYQTDLELTNIETNEKVWIGTKKIKKVVRT